MRILLDTNLLLRLADRGHPQHQPAVESVDLLELDGHEGVLVPQVLYEYWVVATRPVKNNGLGMAVEVANRAISEWKTVFRLLLDERGVFGNWHALVSAHAVKGKNAHDARLVAAMQRHSLTQLLTFNQPDFARFPGIQVWTPADVVAGRLPAKQA